MRRLNSPGVVANFFRRESPIISVALHDGHLIDPEVEPYLLVDSAQRFREEDPYTGFFADLPTSQVIVQTSRFQIDMNRGESNAIYMTPEDAWGLHVYKDIPGEIQQKLLDGHRRFYNQMYQLVSETIDKFGCFLILDIHSYNHRRNHPEDFASEVDNPELNIGTQYNHEKWAEKIFSIILKLRKNSILGQELDVRENVKFGGGALQKWVCEKFGEQGLVLSLEFKKTFMDEWTGRVSIPHVLAIREMLTHSLPMLTHQLLRKPLKVY